MFLTLVPYNFNNFNIRLSKHILIYFNEEFKLKVEKIFYDKLINGGSLFLVIQTIIKIAMDLQKSLQLE